jgi:hypothetical protein
MSKPSNLEIVKGDILNYTEKDYDIIICHQTNCQTKHAAGLAKLLFDKYPEANIYECNSESNCLRIPGNYNVSYTKDEKTIFHLHGQNSPGKCNDKETPEMRLKWMKQILDKMSSIIKKKNYLILFPSMMGCGLAGGNWEDYLALIKDFANKTPHVMVKIVDFN